MTVTTMPDPTTDESPPHEGEENGTAFRFGPPPAEMQPPPAPPPQRAPKIPAPRLPTVPARLAANAMSREMDANQEEYEELLQELDLEGSGKFKTTVTRTFPKDDPETGELFEGHCGTFEHLISQGEIDQAFGGGKYRLMIYGPDSTNPSKTVLRTSRSITIPGFPLPKKRPGATGKRAGGGSDVGTVVDKLTEANSVQLDRLVAALKGKDDGGSTSELVGVLSKMLDPARSAADQAARLKEERDAREQERNDRKEAALEADRRADERARREADERKAERTAEKERHDRDMEMLRMRQTAETEAAKAAAAAAIEATKAQAALQLEAMKQNADAQRQAFELQLATVKAQNDSKEASSMTMAKTLQEMQNSQALTMQALNKSAMEQQQHFAAIERDMLTKQITALQTTSNKGGTKELLETIALVDKIRGNDNEEDEPMALRVVEKLGEAVSKVAPGLFAAAGVGVGARRVRERNENTNTGTEVEPGSVAVVEDGGVRRRKRRLRQREGAPQNAAPKPKVVDAEIVNAAGETGAEGERPNDLTDYVFPSGGPHAELDMPTVELLVKNIDYAMQRQMPAAEIVEKVIKRFPTAVIDYLRDLDIGTILQTLENTEAMGAWLINSNAGQDKLREIHKLLSA